MSFLFLILFSSLYGLTNATNTNSTTVVSEGYWRIATSADSELRCPYGTIACQGGEQAGDFLCTDHFSGLLCGNAISQYYVDWAAQDSRQCGDVVVVSSVFIPTVVILALLIFVCRNVGLAPNVQSLRQLSLLRRTLSMRSGKNVASADPTISDAEQDRRRHRPIAATVSGAQSSLRPAPSSNNSDSSALQSHDAPADISFLHKLKTLIFVLQVTSGLPSMLHTPFGLYFSSLARLMSYLSVASLQALPWDCYSGTHIFRQAHSGGGGGNMGSSHLAYPPNYLEQMEISTVLPVIGILITLIIYLLHMEMIHLLSATAEVRQSVHIRYTKKYGTAVWILWYLGCAGIWQLVAGVLSAECINADTDGVYPTADYTVMLRDVNVFCHRSSYSVGYKWAMVAAALYIVVIPVLKFVLVYHYSDVIKEQSSPAPVLRSISAGASAHSAARMKAGGGGKSTKTSACAALLKYDVSSSGSSGSDSNGSERGGSSRSSESGSERNSGSAPAGTHGSHKSALKNSKPTKGSSKDSMETATPYEILFRKRDTLMYINGVTLLFQAYNPEYYWWEGVDTIVRLCYAAALPALFQYKDPLQLLAAIAATLLFLKVLMGCKPYASAQDQSLAQCALVQILLLLLCATAHELDLPELRLGELLVLDGIMCTVALCTPVLFLYQVFWQPCYVHLQQQDSAHDTAHSPTHLQPTHVPRKQRFARKEVNSAVNGTSQTAQATDRRHRRRSSSATSSSIHAASTALAQSRSPEAVSHRPASATQCSSPKATSSSTLGGARSIKNDRSLLDMCATPPHAGSSRRLSKQRSAIPLSFPYDRDLATYTQETVSYEVLSSQKKKIHKRASSRRRYRDDRSYDEHSDYSEHSSVNDTQSESSAEYKYDSELSTGSEGSFPHYPATSSPRCAQNASFFGRQSVTNTARAPKFPPSPDSTPPSSDCDAPSGSPGAYRSNERPKCGDNLPISGNASANMPARLRPRPLNLNLAPLGGRSVPEPVPALAPAPPVPMSLRPAHPRPGPAAPNLRTASSAAAQRFFARPTSWLADVDAPTAEYGAQLDFPSDSSDSASQCASPDNAAAEVDSPALSAVTPRSPESAGSDAAPGAVGSPLIDYSAELGIYPDTSHCPAFDLSHFRAWSLGSMGEFSDDSRCPWDEPHQRDSLYHSSDRELEPRANLHDMSCGGIEIPVDSSRDEEGKEDFPAIAHPIRTTPQRLSEDVHSCASSVRSDCCSDLGNTNDDNGHHVRLAGGLVCSVETLGTSDGAGEEVGRNIVSIFSNRRNMRTSTPKHATAAPAAPAAPAARTRCTRCTHCTHCMHTAICNDTTLCAAHS